MKYNIYCDESCHLENDGIAEERYIVILEKRPTYYLLITAYYVEYDHNVRKLLKEFEKAKSASAETQLGTPSTFR